MGSRAHRGGLLDAARTAFTHGLNSAALGAAIIMILAAAASAVFFRGVRVESPPRRPANGQPELPRNWPPGEA
jgi:hypothetical protein